MRWAFVLVMCFAGRAAADSRCYAGTQSQEDKSERIVLQVENDAAAHELREQIWSESYPHGTLTTHTLAADGTFTWKSKHYAGTGTMFAKAGKLTGYHREGDLGGKLVTTDTRLDDAKLTMSLRASMDGRPFMTIDIDAKAFDCKDLAAHQTELTSRAPDANRVCYAGESEIVGVQRDPFIVERTTEASRIVLVSYYARGEDHLVMELDGTKISAHNVPHTYGGTGTLAGKSYTLALTGPGSATTKIEGMLDATRFTSTMKETVDGKVVVIKESAGAFDCSELAKRRAALK